MSDFGFDLKMPREDADASSYMVSIIHDEMKDIHRRVIDAMESATRESIIAYMIAHGYVIVTPEQMRDRFSKEASLAYEVKVRDAKIAELESMVVHLRKGGSAAP